MLALHQTIGNRRVARLFEPSAPASTASPCCGDEVIQRKIGFELETGIPITIECRDDKYRDPNVLTDGWKQPVPGGHNLMADHSPGHVRQDPGDFDQWPIVEFVSKPVSDTQDPDDFDAQATKWVNLLGRIRNLMNGTPPPKQLSDVVSAATPAKSIGYVDNQTKTGDRGPNSVSVQYTFGAQLAKMNQVFLSLSKVADNTGGGKSIWEKAAALKTASDNVERMVPALTKKFPTYSTKLFEGKASKTAKKQQGATELADVRGYLEMVSAYLVAGSTVSSRGYVKNRVGIFFKSKLSTVRNKLVAENPYAATLFTVPGNRTWVKAKLMAVNNRAAGEDLFEGMNDPTVSAWIDEVFGGTDDRVFEAARNPWSTEIQPGKVKGKRAAVMEMRTPGTVFSANAAFDLNADRPAIVAYLRRLFEANQAAQGL